MHFHLPKPLHGWREFAGEVGIIVIGVLIALGAEQMVETIHWRIEVQHAREALNMDASDNLRAVAFRQSLQGCVDRRLEEINRLLHARAEGRPVKLLGPIGLPIYNAGPQTAWQISVASDALAHMSLDEKLDYGSAFGNYENFDQILKSEQDAWVNLGPLDDPELLSDTDWSNLRQAYSQARAINQRLKIVVPYILSINMGQRPSSGELPESVRTAVKHFCTPVLGADSVDQSRAS